MRTLSTVIPIAMLLAACAAPSDHSSADRSSRPVATDDAPAAIGPYSQAVQVGNMLYLSGQIGLDPQTGELVDGGVEAETRRTMENLEAVLAAAGFSMGDVVEAEVFLADLGDYAAMNEVYGSYFDETPPARAAVQVARLPRDARVEIKLTAVK